MNRSPFTSAGIRHLEQTYSALEREEKVGPHKAYETLLELLCAGITGKLPKGSVLSPEKVASYEPLLKAWFEGWVTHPTLEDDIGAIMEMRAFATFDSAGQFLTPMNVCRMTAKMTLDEATVWRAYEQEGRLARVIDPCCGTGRMLMAAAESTLDWKVPFVLCAVDIDVRMVRATILNLVLANIWREMHGATVGLPGFALWADSLAVELTLGKTWESAGRWEQPHWSTLPALGSGQPVKKYGILAYTEDGEAAPVESVAQRREARHAAPRATAKRGKKVDAPAAVRQARLGEE